MEGPVSREEMGVMAKKKTPAIPSAERAVYERMRDWAERLNAFMRMYDDRGFLPRSQLEKARALYREIKEDLRAEHQQAGTRRGTAALAKNAEYRWYERTVHQAYAGLAPINYAPEKWFSGLFSARSDFTHTMSQMRSVYDIPED
jgi:hypothetical protein